MRYWRQQCIIHFENIASTLIILVIIFRGWYFVFTATVICQSVLEFITTYNIYFVNRVYANMLPARILLYQEMREENRRVHLQNAIIECRLLRNKSDPFSLDDVEFINLFRLSKDLVHYLVRTLSPHITTATQTSTISPQMKIFSALDFYATGSYQRTVGQSYNLSMSQQSVSRCVKEISSLIVRHLIQDWVKFPQTAAEKGIIKQQFMTNFGFPGVLGCIDCTHVALIAPRHEEHNYVNRKGYHSKNVQLICDFNLKIIGVNARYAGATHYAAIWHASIVQNILSEAYRIGDHNSWLLGDSGYPQQPWLMTPVLNAVPGSPEERYNRRHCSARNCIERCNGVLKTRFRCLMEERVLRYSPERVGTIINACVVLHNMCVEARMENVEDMEYHVYDVPLLQHAGILLGNEGRRARAQLISRYF